MSEELTGQQIKEMEDAWNRYGSGAFPGNGEDCRTCMISLLELKERGFMSTSAVRDNERYSMCMRLAIHEGTNVLDLPENLEALSSGGRA